MIYDILMKRRKIAIIVIASLFVLSFVFNAFVTFEPVDYFGGKYNNLILISLFVYKLIELVIIYFLLIYRHLKVLESETFLDDEKKKTLKKHMKLFYFLVPQGNIVFGMISYKISSEVFYFIIYLIIALVTLISVKPSPHKLKLT